MLVQFFRVVMGGAVLVAVLGVGTTASAAVVEVHVFDFDFSNDPTIQLGDTVRWVFDQPGHTSTAYPGQLEFWDSGFVSAGGTYDHMFRNLGRFDYYCQPHQSFMTGSITVVPEPAAGVLAVPAAALLIRRRRT
jgi:plastocyanin